MRAKWIAIAAVVSIALALIALGGTLYAAVVASGPPPVTPPPPVYTPTPEEPPMTPAEERQAREKEAKEARGYSRAASGPDTKGSKITVVGKEVPLPSDAFVSRYIVETLCVTGWTCSEVPMYELRRGNSSLAVSAPPESSWRRRSLRARREPLTS